MLTVSKDAEFLNSVVNHPSVLPFVCLGVEGPLDTTGLLADEDNVFLANEHGGFLFVRDGDWYEVHTQFLEAGRGSKAVRAAREAAAYMFCRTPCLGIKTFVPKGNRPAQALAIRAGFTAWGLTDLNGKRGVVYALTIKEWAKGLNVEDVCR